MPLYDFETEDGELLEDVYVPLAEFTETILIWDPKVGHKFFRLKVALPAVHDWGEFQEGRYFEHVSATGERFSSKTEFKEYLKRHGMAEHGSYG